MLGHALDGLGKGYAAIEVRWDTSRSPWVPRDRTDPATGERIRAYRWIDPRWFRYDRVTGRSLRLLDDSAPFEGLPLPPYRYIVYEPELMSGLPLGAGLARVAAIAYMAKSYTLRDWLAFAEVYGMPLRLGKWGPGASEEDIATLVSAVANLGTDAAAAIPESMSVEFVEASRASSSEVFSGLAQWADRQMSKLVLGQVASVEGQPGSLGAQQAQDEVRADLRDADAEELADTLNRDLVGAYLALNHGPIDPEAAPRLIIQAQEPEDIQALSDALAALVPLGLRVEASVIRDKLGLPDPAPGAEVLGAPAAPVGAGLPALNRALAESAAKAALTPDYAETHAAALEASARPGMESLLGAIRDAIDAAIAAGEALPELASRLLALYPRLPTSDLTAALGSALAAAELAGRYDLDQGDWDAEHPLCPSDRVRAARGAARLRGRPGLPGRAAAAERGDPAPAMVVRR